MRLNLFLVCGKQVATGQVADTLTVNFKDWWLFKELPEAQEKAKNKIGRMNNWNKSYVYNVQIDLETGKDAEELATVLLMNGERWWKRYAYDLMCKSQIHYIETYRSQAVRYEVVVEKEDDRFLG